MNLQGLIAAGALVRTGLVVKNISWKYRNEAGEVVVCDFDIHIKQSMSAADFEFIYAKQFSEDVRMAKRVHRLVYLGEKGEETIPYDAAASMRPDLLMLMCNEINEVEKSQLATDKTPEGDEEKK